MQKKQSIKLSIYDNTYTFLTPIKLQLWGKRHRKLYSTTHTVLLLVIWSTDNRKQLFHIMIKL